MAHAVIVGAGLAGLTAANTLLAGRDGSGGDWTVTLLDKSVGPGGRMATRRIGDASFDHGAQFFTVRSDEFAALVERWTASGCPIRVWGNGLASVRHIDDGPDAAEEGGDGYPRYCVRTGMNALAKHISAGLDIQPDHRVQAVAVDAGRWRIETGATVMEADALVLTPPVPQTLALLDAGGTVLDRDDRDVLEGIAYEPCLAVLLTLDRSVHLPEPGGVQIDKGPVQVLSDNQAKGTSRRPGLTVHLRDDVSRQRYRDPPGAVVSDTLDHLEPWLGGAEVTGWQLQRWRYAQPVSLPDQRAVHTSVDGAPVVFAGDAFGEAKIEGAVRSGLAAARALLG